MNGAPTRNNYHAGIRVYGALGTAAIAINLISSARSIPSVLHGGLIDPDSFMRLLRIGQGVRLGHLVNMVQRDDLGTPLLIEWSRLFDAIIVALATPLAPWLGWHRALFAAGVATGPLAIAGLAMSLAFAAAPLTQRHGGRPTFLWAVPMIGLLLPGIRSFATFGTIHYHIAQIALVALTIGYALRAGTGDRRAAWSCGVAGGFAIWMMPETMPFVLLADVGLGYLWLFRPLGGIIARLGGGFAITLVLALTIDPPHGGILIPEIDRLSIVYAALGIAVAIAGLWLAGLDRRNLPPERRAILGIGGALIAFALWLARFPTVALGPYGLIPASDMRQFFGNMSETQPVHDISEAALLLGPGGLALAYALLNSARHRRSPPGCGLWLIGAAAIALGLGLTARFVIFAPYPAAAAALLLPVALADASARWSRQPSRAAIARVSVIAVTLFAPYTPAFAAAKSSGPTGKCHLRHIAPLLRPAADSIVLAPIEDVPELLYRSRIIGVGSLYQHGIPFYLLAYHAWRADAAGTQPAAIRATRARFVLFCNRTSNRPPLHGAAKSSLWTMLAEHHIPAWLDPVGTDQASGFTLYRVRSASP
jgi:hypothetical protein